MNIFDTIGGIFGKTGNLVKGAGKLILTVMRVIKRIKRGPKNGIPKSTKRNKTQKTKSKEVQTS